MDTLRISCDDCSMRHTEVCDDCLVTFVCTRDAEDAVVFDIDEQRALRRLQNQGLLPQVRHAGPT